MEGVSLGGIFSWIGLICLWIVVIWQIIDWRKRKKEGTYEVIPKDSWWKQTYVWQVFFRRSRYRPVASAFPWIIFILPSMFMVLFYSIGLFQGHPLRLDEMNQLSGVVTKVHRGKGKGSFDYIRVKDDSGNEDNYRVYSFLNEAQVEEYRRALQDENKKITIWYQNRSYLWEHYKEVMQVEVNNQALIVNGIQQKQYNYQANIERYSSYLPNLLWWLKYSLLGWLWLWFLNKKELPIHRLNKEKFYKKYNLKDE